MRREIQNREVPLPPKWENFIALAENKADLANFLSRQLILRAPENKIVVVSGGFKDEQQVESSAPGVNTDELEAKHEEADTRLILHCVKSQASSVVVAARDTDVLVLLLAHFSKMPSTKVWMKAGTSKNRKYIPIHTIVDQILPDNSFLGALPAFHSLTGSDTTSFLAGHSKKSCLKVFKEHHDLLATLGKDELSHQACANAEAFICKVYNMDTASVDNARSILFARAQPLETLPPTHDALSFHIMRAHYQALVWNQAYKQYPVLPKPETMGWKINNDAFVPILTSLPAVPEACVHLISCGCKTQCQRSNCQCRKQKLQCTSACKCSTGDSFCRNRIA